MAEPFWKLDSKSGLILAIYALSESGNWSRKVITKWADYVLASVDVPQVWVVDVALATAGVETDLESTFQKLFIDNNVTAPDGFYEVCAGLALVRYDQGLIPDQEARDLIADFSDPGGVAGFQVEEIAGVDLNDQKFQNVRDFATAMIEFVYPENLLPRCIDFVSV